MQAALNEPSIVDSVSPVDLKEMVQLAGRAIMQRLRDDPDSMPMTFTMKLFLDGSKAIAAGSVPDPEDEGAVDIITALDSLPPEHARELLGGEIQRVGALLAALTDKMRELEEL